MKSLVELPTAVRFSNALQFSNINNRIMEHDEASAREYYGKDYSPDILEQHKVISERRERGNKTSPFVKNFVSNLRNKHFDNFPHEDSDY
jgi:hypothetical protein